MGNFIRKSLNSLVNVPRNITLVLRDFSPLPTINRCGEFYCRGFGIYDREDSFFRGSYETHVKDLINSIYNRTTRNGSNVANIDFYGVINDNRPKILEHFSTYAKKSNVNLSEIFFKIAKARENQDKESEVQLKNHLNDEFLKIHDNVNHKLDFDFGFCSDCIGKKTKIPFWNRRKLTKIKT